MDTNLNKNIKTATNMFSGICNIINTSTKNINTNISKQVIATNIFSGICNIINTSPNTEQNTSPNTEQNTGPNTEQNTSPNTGQNTNKVDITPTKIISGVFNIINSTNKLITDNNTEINAFIKKCEIDIINDDKIVGNTGTSLKQHLNYKYNQYEKKIGNIEKEMDKLKDKLTESNLTKEEIIELKDKLTAVEQKININKLKQTFNGVISKLAEKYNYDILFNPEIISKEFNNYKISHFTILKNQFIKYIDTNNIDTNNIDNKYD
uniref:Uncharacterized protein n=1 Tax=viral metagenome TaxID=1070528 RepID=A0A6C0EJE5_9ZZZZ